jgi:hypothetical protein
MALSQLAVGKKREEGGREGERGGRRSRQLHYYCAGVLKRRIKGESLARPTVKKYR